MSSSSKNFVFDYDNNSINSYKEGLDFFKKNGIINSYCRELEFEGKEFISELALDILKLSSVCQRYFFSKYDTIYNDEAQDYNKSQINLLDFLYSELKIKLILVGDISQSIYG